MFYPNKSLSLEERDYRVSSVYRTHPNLDRVRWSPPESNDLLLKIEGLICNHNYIFNVLSIVPMTRFSIFSFTSNISLSLEERDYRVSSVYRTQQNPGRVRWSPPESNDLLLKIEGLICNHNYTFNVLSIVPMTRFSIFSFTSNISLSLEERDYRVSSVYRTHPNPSLKKRRAYLKS
jgi:hypothetical protein